MRVRVRGRRRAPGPEDAVEVLAVPYPTWANRGPGAMRVWLPTT